MKMKNLILAGMLTGALFMWIWHAKSLHSSIAPASTIDYYMRNI